VNTNYQNKTKNTIARINDWCYYLFFWYCQHKVLLTCFITSLSEGGNIHKIHSGMVPVDNWKWIHAVMFSQNFSNHSVALHLPPSP
jgi:choline-glycine betaine transporter